MPAALTSVLNNDVISATTFTVAGTTANATREMV
jgi:hypothetical protein